MDHSMPILNEREKTHGDFVTQSKTAQRLKHTVRDTPNWQHLPAPLKESLELICTKLARIGHGDWQCVDHYADISGYAQLIVDALQAPSRDS